MCAIIVRRTWMPQISSQDLKPTRQITKIKFTLGGHVITMPTDSHSSGAL